MVYQIELDDEKKWIIINDQRFPIRRIRNEADYEISLPVSADRLSGKLTFHRFMAKSQEELVSKIRDCIQIPKEEMGLKEEDYSVEKYYEIWKEGKKGELSQATRQRNEDAFRQEIYPYFANMRLEDINRKQIDEWLAKKREREQEWSVAQGYRLLRLMLVDAEAKRYIPARPWMPRQTREKTGFRSPLTKDQQDYIYENREKDLFWTMIYVMRIGGLRTGEVIVLQDTDCDFVRKKLWVRHQLVTSRQEFADGMVHKPYTKTKQVRAVDLDDECIRLIQKIWKEQEKIRYRHLIHFSEAYLFLREDGSFIRPEDLRRAFQDYMEGTGPSVTLHSLRNTCACNMYEKDEKRDLDAVMRQLGVTKQTALRYISETQVGTTFVANALENWILNELEVKKMVGDEKEVQFELFCEEPYIEVLGNLVTLSAASVGLLAHMPYVRMGFNKENMQLTVRGSTMPLCNLPLEGHLIPQKNDKYATKAAWYVPEFAKELESILGDELNVEQGVRMIAQYDPEERTLLFDLHNVVQMKDASLEQNQPEKKKRGRRKKGEVREENTDSSMQAETNAAGASDEEMRDHDPELRD